MKNKDNDMNYKHGPDVWEVTDNPYPELRHRAGEMGFATVHDALDRLEKYEQGELVTLRFNCEIVA